MNEGREALVSKNQDTQEDTRERGRSMRAGRWVTVSGFRERERDGTTGAKRGGRLVLVP